MAEPEHDASSPPPAPPLGDLLRSLVDDTRRLVRDEIDLARTEMKENARRALRETIILALGVTLTIIAFVALMTSITFGLVAALSPLIGQAAALWVAPLLMCVMAATAAAVLIRGAIMRLRAQSLAPRRALSSARETARSLIDRLPSSMKEQP
jgi:hypothetical protein